MKWTERKMQIALTSRGCLFFFRRYAVVPNVSWGIGLSHEADLLCLSAAGVFHEVEIKVTLADLRAERNKRHTHYNKYIRHLWFAIPDTIDIDAVKIPDYAGLVVVSMYDVRGKDFFKTKIIRRPRPKRRKGAIYEKPSERMIEKFLRLGVMRMWSRRGND